MGASYLEFIEKKNRATCRPRRRRLFNRQSSSSPLLLPHWPSAAGGARSRSRRATRRSSGFGGPGSGEVSGQLGKSLSLFLLSETEIRKKNHAPHTLLSLRKLPAFTKHSPPTARNHPTGARRTFYAERLLDGAPRAGLRFDALPEIPPGRDAFPGCCRGKGRDARVRRLPRLGQRRRFTCELPGREAH